MDASRIFTILLFLAIFKITALNASGSTKINCDGCTMNCIYNCFPTLITTPINFLTPPYCYYCCSMWKEYPYSSFCYHYNCGNCNNFSPTIATNTITTTTTSSTDKGKYEMSNTMKILISLIVLFGVILGVVLVVIRKEITKKCCRITKQKKEIHKRSDWSGEFLPSHVHQNPQRDIDNIYEKLQLHEKGKYEELHSNKNKNQSPTYEVQLDYEFQPELPARQKDSNNYLNKQRDDQFTKTNPQLHEQINCRRPEYKPTEPTEDHGAAYEVSIESLM